MTDNKQPRIKKLPGSMLGMIMTIIRENGESLIGNSYHYSFRRLTGTLILE